MGEKRDMVVTSERKKTLATSHGSFNMLRVSTSSSNVVLNGFATMSHLQKTEIYFS